MEIEKIACPVLNEDLCRTLGLRNGIPVSHVEVFVKFDELEQKEPLI